jgi:predicted peptidase
VSYHRHELVLRPSGRAIEILSAPLAKIFALFGSFLLFLPFTTRDSPRLGVRSLFKPTFRLVASGQMLANVPLAVLSLEVEARSYRVRRGSWETPRFLVFRTVASFTTRSKTNGKTRLMRLTKNSVEGAGQAKMNLIRITMLFAATIVTTTAMAADRWYDLYEPQVFDSMPCRVMKPQGFEEERKYPVIVSLHGAGGKGTKNDKQLKDWNKQLADTQRRKDFPCYVVAPQANELWSADHLDKIKRLIATLPSVDLDRIYILGHSMGGHGAYIFIQLDPRYFAAAAPSAGSGLRRTEDFIDPAKLKHLPIWAFHGDKDGVCPIEKDQKVFDELKRLGGNMKLTVWEGGNHGVSGKFIVGAENGITHFSSIKCDRETDFMTWLFKQSRKKNRTKLP